jgi:hypothetical protein
MSQSSAVVSVVTVRPFMPGLKASTRQFLLAMMSEGKFYKFVLMIAMRMLLSA